ncbi:MAG: hypothetical protein GWN99_15685 [Gemmatimonadetes bacterium]|uniref:DUF5666 domain-containing protein n=1 Tax=Candidatus Kutchimonas denitrificans TaxID=3056748 RepID=A0AAE4Z999_9BACT|nr:hypothetical protein [Gemmatimonadota bacterium]NIR73841.1 hypothetical protein [Candidatus Kutchimonas denitrificans]NIS02486.1 hypothetical protein [Gemmatimonadota bacterium]NIT68354.1 hypothetical protein [Gemmatimonadota bacterium]NIU51621.1 hypothetical protein [Gemmatimonadota bacterium]
MPGATKPALAPALAALFIVAAIAGASTATGLIADPSSAPDHLKGTIRYIDTNSGGLEVITGFHLALKIVYVHVEESTAITMEGESYPFSDLEAGDIVAVEYHEADDRKIADSIEVIESMAEGGAR